jgi:hypothetical protein
MHGDALSFSVRVSEYCCESSYSMTEHEQVPASSDPGLRRVMKWVIVALVATLALAIVVVEITMRWFNR